VVSWIALAEAPAHTPLFESSLVSFAGSCDVLLGDSSVRPVPVGKGISAAFVSVRAGTSRLGLGLTRFRGLSGAIEMPLQAESIRGNCRHSIKVGMI
jgi:hypothetical protein